MRISFEDITVSPFKSKNLKSCLPGLLFLLFVPYVLQSQSIERYNINYVGITDGLSNNYVSKIITGKNGLKWIATEGGLNSYDGNTFSIFKPGENTTGLENENIETIFEDHNGNIWVGTKSGGLSKYNPVSNIFSSYNSIFPVERESKAIRVTSISEGPQGNIWVGTWNKGVFIIEPDKKELIKALHKSSQIDDIYCSSDGSMWISGKTFLHRYNLVQNSVMKYSVPARITKILEDTLRKRTWLSSFGGGLFYLEQGTNEAKRVTKKKEIQGIKTLALDEQFRLWVGTWGSGVYISDSSGVNFHKKSVSPLYLGKLSATYESVIDIHIDKNNVAWLSTAYGGIVKLTPANKFDYLGNFPGKSIGLSDNNIQTLLIDSDSTLWCGTYNGGVNISNDYQTFRHLEHRRLTKINTILEVNRHMLIGAREGLFVLNRKNPDIRPFRLLRYYQKITCLHLDKKQNLWVGTQQNGLGIVNIGKNLDIKSLQEGSVLKKPEGWSGNERISTIVEGPRGNIWIGTYNGLFVYGTEISGFIPHEKLVAGNLPSVIIHSIYFDSSGELWLGTPGGLIKLEVDLPEVHVVGKYDKESGLASDFITSVTGDEKDNIWLGSSLGISKLSTDRKTVVNFGATDGIKTSSLNINAVINTRNHKIFFGGVNGATAFYPLEIKKSTSAPNVIFTDFKVNNKSVKANQELNGRVILKKSVYHSNYIRLTHKEKIFSIVFQPVDFMGTENIKFRYRLKGFRDEWIDNQDKNEVSFSGLNSGEYTFEVACTRDNQNWGEVSSIQFKIASAPWFAWYAFLVYTAILLLIIFSITFSILRQTKLEAKLEVVRIEKEKEHELTDAKLTFFTNISHELRTPLTLIISPLTEMLAIEKFSAPIKERLILIENNANRLLHLINQLLDFRKAEKGALEINVINGELIEFCREISITFKSFAKTKKIEFSFIPEVERLKMFFDPDKMEIVISNLLTNAFKYTPANGSVVLKISKDEKYCVIKVKDTGTGLSKENADKIFDRFFQIGSTNTSNLSGSGIGLALSKQIVEMHNGKIEVESTPGKGTEFFVYLPFKSKNQVTDHTKPSKDPEHLTRYTRPKETLMPSTETSKKDPEQQLQLLIADDHPEIRNYLKGLFADDYEVLEAKNGEEALKIATEQLPDIIISDVMMPVMDGIELCKRVKSQVSTSHIPVILLTARTSAVYELNGFDTGADDYIKKPFNPLIVKSRTNNLIENRNKLRDYFTRKIRFEPTDFKVKNAEEDFIQKAMKIVEGNFRNENFGIEVLTGQLFMSQSTLYRKIKSLTGMSITGFVRSIRLKEAARLILSEDLKLNQVAEDVGFNDYKYFKDCFKKQFGCLPSDYKSKVLGKSKG